MTDQEEIARQTLQKYWGYGAFRPLQWEAIQEVLERRDSLVVLPTGGGKSLCYQVPATMREGMMVVVSPLIALMKDQVDALRENGIAAAAINSSLNAEEKREITSQIRNGELKLLYVAPEKLCTSGMISFLQQVKVSAFAIDEAHCISTWGHQFRPEYRLLGSLREHFPEADLHAYTATATEQVRNDICEQLKLREPRVLVGNFDRPNLVYRIRQRENLDRQLSEFLDQQSGNAGIIYCITRRKVDELTERLRDNGYSVTAYHAGLDHETRVRAQDDFLSERTEIVVATIAFGMGIDKSNVRFVVHTGASKSVENYQQEAGRAGRDGLPADCVMFYSGQDFMTWRRMMSDLTGESAEIAERQLERMSKFCSSLQCRHRTLVEHFGQEYEAESCGACDVCLGEMELMPDSLIVAQKILSCVVRVEQKFGADYVAQVLTGSRDQRILSNGHEELSTYGLLKAYRKSAVRGWIEQLLDQQFLMRRGDHQTLAVTDAGRAVFHREAEPQLTRVTQKKTRPDRAERGSGQLEESARELFEALRTLRRQLAEEQQIPSFIVFGDVSLIDMANKKPTTSAEFLQIHGVGQKKAEQYGEAFLAEIQKFTASEADEVSASIPTE
ncbi:MAG: DNA helicase RecQ [Planctomycetaceae bacterium]|nr:DNA helicase RecQ [Planctomycetaceae bacterium]